MGKTISGVASPTLLSSPEAQRRQEAGGRDAPATTQALEASILPPLPADSRRSYSWDTKRTGHWTSSVTPNSQLDRERRENGGDDGGSAAKKRPTQSPQSL